MDVADLFSLKGRVALITGGSKNLGRHMAEGFLAAGAQRVYVSSRKADACERTAKELGPKCVALPMDVSSVDACKALAASLAAKEDKLDILVNNAGAAWGEAFEDFPESGWDKVFDLNVKAPFFLTQALYPLLKAAANERPAKVINIGSIDGIRLNPWETYSYHASKAAILYLTRRLAARLVSDQINVTAIAPGAFASDMNRAARDHGDAVALNIPNKRIGTAADIAAAAIYLASRAGDYIVGDTITVDGGVAHANIGTPSIDVR